MWLKKCDKEREEKRLSVRWKGVLKAKHKKIVTTTLFDPKNSEEIPRPLSQNRLFFDGAFSFWCAHSDNAITLLSQQPQR